jgi:hypothetical protein
MYEQTRIFALPSAITELNKARQLLVDHYSEVIRKKNGDARLSFNFDGNLVGDIGEARAAELFDLRLVETSSNKVSVVRSFGAVWVLD